MRDQRGVVYAETLVAFLPVFSLFLATIQLADLSVAQLVVQHASTTAVRAAAVVLPDDGSYYGDRDNQALHQYGGSRQADVEQAADLVLRANPRIERTAANVGLDKSRYADREDLTATVQARYRCLLPLFCGGGVALRSESKLVYQGARYVYEVTELGDVRPGRQPPGDPPPLDDDPANDLPSDSDPPRPPRAQDRPPVADNGRPPRGQPFPGDDGRPGAPDEGRPPAVAAAGDTSPGHPARRDEGRASRPSDHDPIAAVTPPADAKPGEGRPGPSQGKPSPGGLPSAPVRPGPSQSGLGAQAPPRTQGPVVADARNPNDAPMGPPTTCRGGTCPAPGQCFAAGTLVHTAEGDRPIESIVAGDLVWSRDEVTGTVALKPVIRRYVTDDMPVLDLLLSAAHRDERIVATPEHPFWVAQRGWVAAGQLGDRALLWSPEGSLVGHQGAAWGARTKVYNLEVADYHTYFVGALHAWVHNQCGPFSGRQWNDPNLSVNEFIADYRQLNPHSRLTDQQLQDAFDAGERVHPHTGRLRNVSAEDAPRVDALHDPNSPLREDIPLGDLPRAARRELGRILAERTRADRRWQALENDPSARAEDVNAARYEVIDASRRAGEAAAEAAAARIAAGMPGGRLERLYPAPNDADPSSQSGDFDRVFAVRFDDGRPTQYLVIEAKGGSSGLGTRMVDGDRAQQGTLLYYMSIVNNMSNSADPAMRAAGRELGTNLGPNAHYLHVQLPVQRSPGNGGSVPGEIRVNEFDIFGPDPFPPRPSPSGP